MVHFFDLQEYRGIIWKGFVGKAQIRKNRFLERKEKEKMEKRATRHR